MTGKAMISCRRFGPIIAGASWLLFAGCDAGTPTLVPVSGKVLYQNQPLPRGTIVFVPDADRGNNGPLAQGTIQAGGSYTVQTECKPRAAPGLYGVRGIAVEAPAAFSTSHSSAQRPLWPERKLDP